MSTTFVPKYDRPIPKDLDLEELRKDLQDNLEIFRGDEDKADTIEDSCWYEGNASAIEWILRRLTGILNERNECTNPECPDKDKSNATCFGVCQL